MAHAGSRLLSAAALAALAVSSDCFHPARAKQHALFAAAAYCAREDVKSWNCTPCLRTPAVSRVHHFTNTTANIAGYVAQLDDPPGTIILGFKGTNPEDVQNILLDLEWGKTDIYPGCADCAVHSGFYSGWAQSAGAVLDALDEFGAAGDGTADQPPIILTGHSLGGALATLASYELTIAGYRVEAVTTLGCPRVGNGPFAASFDAVVNRGDLAQGGITMEDAFAHALAVDGALPRAAASARRRMMLHLATTAGAGAPATGVVAPSAALRRAAANAGCALRPDATHVECPRPVRLTHSRAQRHAWRIPQAEALGTAPQPPPPEAGSSLRGAPVPAVQPVRTDNGVISAGDCPPDASVSTDLRSDIDHRIAGGATWGAVRIVHASDVIPHLPFKLLGYAHPPREVWYRDCDDWAPAGNASGCARHAGNTSQADGPSQPPLSGAQTPQAQGYRVCSSEAGEDPTCSDSLWLPISVVDHAEYLGLRISRMCAREDSEDRGVPGRGSAAGADDRGGTAAGPARPPAADDFLVVGELPTGVTSGAPYEPEPALPVSPAVPGAAQKRKAALSADA